MAPYDVPPPLGMTAPEGLKVIELASVLAGLLVGTFLAELGAEVVKVEMPATGISPAVGASGESTDGPSAYYVAANGPKQGLRLNLKTETGQRELDALLAEADILLQNARPDSLEMTGLDPSRQAERHPRQIHVHLHGFLDQPGRAGYDIVVQAESGFLSMNGEPGGSPFRMPVALMDVLAAHQMRSALLLALYDRERSGQGAYVETWLDASGFSGPPTGPRSTSSPVNPRNHWAPSTPRSPPTASSSSVAVADGWPPLAATETSGAVPPPTWTVLPKTVGSTPTRIA